MRKLKLTITVLLLTLSTLSAQQTTQVIEDILAEVNLDSLKSHVMELSGEKEVYINGSLQTITGRNSFYSGNELAAQYLKEKLLQYGYEVEEQVFDDGGKNIIARKTGTDTTKIIIGAHYDSMPINVISPGADDNASGTACVIEAARVLKDYLSDYTLEFILFDKEEQGLFGSKFNAQYSVDNDINIKHMINIDMIAWDSNNDRKADIHTRPVAQSVELANLLYDVNTDYNIGLDLAIENPGITYSDHSPYWTKGYSAILLIEDYSGDNSSASDFNDYYHTNQDLLTHFNDTTFFMLSKLAIASFALDAEVSKPLTDVGEKLIVSNYLLLKSYPNPFNPSTTIEFTVPVKDNVKLFITNILGKRIATVVNSRYAAGTHNINFNASDYNLSSGMYLVTLQTNGKMISHKILLAK